MSKTDMAKVLEAEEASREITEHNEQIMLNIAEDDFEAAEETFKLLQEAVDALADAIGVKKEGDE
jgi:hypothetical protein